MYLLSRKNNNSRLNIKEVYEVLAIFVCNNHQLRVSIRKKCPPPLKADQFICSKSETTPGEIKCKDGITYKALNIADEFESFLQNNKGPQVNNDNNNNMGVEYEPRDSRNPSVPRIIAVIKKKLAQKQQGIKLKVFLINHKFSQTLDNFLPFLFWNLFYKIIFSDSKAIRQL